MIEKLSTCLIAAFFVTQLAGCGGDTATTIIGAALYHMSDREFDAAKDNIVLGRFVTERPQGITLHAKIDLDESNSPVRDADKVVEFMGWDCAGIVPGDVSMKSAVPGGRKENTFYFPFLQRYSQQCRKLWATDVPTPTSSTWRLVDSSLVPNELSFIERIGREKRVQAKIPRIAHAGGGVDGKTYTNSIAALDHNYQAGFRFFEIDFIWTSDGHLVCGHDWGYTARNNYGLEYATPPSLAQSREDLKNQAHAPCTLSELDQWMGRHPDARVVTDIKKDNLKGLSVLRKSFPVLAARAIPQIYAPSEHANARKLGYDEIILTLYKYPKPAERLLEEIVGLELLAVTMPQRRALDGLGVRLNSLGFTTYTHTINANDRFYQMRKHWGIDEIYTDVLAPKHTASDVPISYTAAPTASSNLRRDGRRSG